MRNCNRLIVALFLTATGFVTIAQEDDRLQRLDTDKDGNITIKEAVADPELLAVFGRIDSNGDGKISRMELARAQYAKLIQPRTSTGKR